MVWQTILLAIGILMIFDSLFVLLFPRWVKRRFRFLKKGNLLRNLGLTELVVGTVFIILSVYL